ncbi:MAG: M23 family metallopeptidase [Candidatus Tenebribacter burtonii]|jgi:murein DD-endopeptidase MepM/ murein hydrolase activator NlpD|nr:M23 family metallopeptidase [Candidatus Tenebribacter burtonii]
MKISASLIRAIVITILLIIVITDFFYIKLLKNRIDNITVLTSETDSMVVVKSSSFKEPIVVFTADFIDNFYHYSSPFKDGMDFNELIKKYIRNRWADHYGCGRGTRERKRIHEGIDLFVPENTPVYPLTNFGIVTNVSDNPHFMVQVQYIKPGGIIDSMKIEYGKTIRILYPEGIESIYTHLNEVFVELNQKVDRNTVVGLTGLTGNIRNSGKPSHLHMELRDSENRSFDPRNRLRFVQNSAANFIKHINIGDE